MNVSDVRTVPVSTIPSIEIFVRHSADCPRRDDPEYKKCNCPKHLRYTHEGKQRRQSAKTRSWKTAEERRRKLEVQFESADPAKPIGSVQLEAQTAKTMERAIELFLSDKRSQGLKGGVLAKYERELGRFEEFMAKRSKFFPHEIRLEDLTEFRAGWTHAYPSSLTRSKVQERLRAFLRYCYESKLIDRVPKLSAIKVSEPPTIPLEAKQYAKLLKVIPDEFSGDKAKRVHALVRLMRYSGLAIHDAVVLERIELHHDRRKGLYRIVTSRQKTGTDVSVPIPPYVAEEVLSVMTLNKNPKYIFWNTGTGKPQTAVTNWQHDLRQAFRAAGMPDGHPHQLRDTFAVGLLEHGVPLEEVSKLLGHESIKTTERYYAKWVKARQDRLDTLVVATWAEAEHGEKGKHHG
jgi:integrase/recombinase XerD